MYVQLHRYVVVKKCMMGVCQVLLHYFVRRCLHMWVRTRMYTYRMNIGQAFNIMHCHFHAILNEDAGGMHALNYT